MTKYQWAGFLIFAASYLWSLILGSPILFWVSWIVFTLVMGDMVRNMIHNFKSK